MSRQWSRPWELALPLPFGRSNIQNFLHFVKPVVPSKIVPRSSIGGINNSWLMDNGDSDSIEFFSLGDLWEIFDEWCAYGVGTPVVVNHSTTVMQYFVPYLSAIQIYTAKSATGSSSGKEAGDPTQMDSGSSSEGSETGDRSRINLGKSPSKEYSTSSSSGSSRGSFDRDSNRHFGHLYFSYHDVAAPFWRAPLFEQVMDFAGIYPNLMTLKNVDLSPASWMSIVWYPIYPIPTCYSKDLGTSFLTYHTLSSSFQDIPWKSGCKNDLKGKDKEELQSEVKLPAFGLATFKMTGEVWMNHDKYDRERMLNLYNAADSWLKQLNFQHHDFNFFKMRS